MDGKLYTHDLATEIVDLFEETLSAYDIKVPSPDDDEREEGNEAPLYGSTYGDLQDGVEALLMRALDEAGVTDYVPDVFSGSLRR